MAMNPRLLRPRASGVHPEAQVWRNAVIANGGTVSGSTLTAVSRFCVSIDAAGLRDRLFRLNLFCGGGLSAALVPLYRGQSRTGTQFGNTTDTNNNFVSGDYVETGATGGLKGNGFNKFLATGFLPNTLTLGNTHLSAYAVTANQATIGACALGSFNSSGSSELALYFIQGSINTTAYFAENNAAGFVVSANNNPTGHLLGTATSTTDRRFFLNGSQSGSTATSTSTIALEARELYVFARNANTSLRLYSSPRIGAYSIGYGMSAAQGSAFYAAMQAFQTALTRNV